MTSETRTAYGSFVRLHGRSRPWSSNQARSASSTRGTLVGKVAHMPARTPASSRPRFPDVYGISEDPNGLLDWTWATERLESARNYWVVTAGSDGRPHAAPVWALWLDDAV